jgi:hypothetical protein
MLGFAPLCSVPLCDIWEAVVTPPDPWEDYRDLSVGAGIPEQKKKKKKKKRVTVEEMVYAIAAAPALGKEAVLEAMPRAVRRELQPEVDLLPLYRLVQEVQNASAAARARIAKLYADLEDEDEDDELLLMMM